MAGAVTCPSCGHVNDASDRYCEDCGAQLTATPPSASEGGSWAGNVTAFTIVLMTLAGVVLVLWYAAAGETSDENGGRSGAASTRLSQPAPTQTPPPPSAKQPSLRGGIGNTRADIYATYGQPERTEVIGESAFADYASFSVGFVTETEGSEGANDRVMDIIMYPDAADRPAIDAALGIAGGLLPRDASPQGNLYRYEISGVLIDYRQKYHSDALATVVPGPARVYCGEDPDDVEPAGTFWVRLEPSGSDADQIRAIHVTTQGC